MIVVKLLLSVTLSSSITNKIDAEVKNTSMINTEQNLQAQQGKFN